MLEVVAWKPLRRVSKQNLRRPGAGLAAVLPALVGAIDDYLAAIGADGTLGGALDEELTILAVAPGVVTYAGTRYYGVRFVHRWRRVV